MPHQHEVMTTWQGVMLVMMPTVLSGLRLLGVEPGLAQAWQTAFSLACLAPVLWLLWRLRAPLGDPAAAALVLTAGTVLVAPYSFVYDMGALAAVGSAMFAREAAPAGNGGAQWRPLLATACLLLCLLPVLTMLLGLLGLPVAPLLAAAALAVLALPAALPHARRRAIA
jgi:hypothetical protein